MAEWSKLIPEGDVPREVERARHAVEELKAKLPAQREALAAAQAAVTTAEANDRERMAEALREGRVAKADVRAVDKAQQHVAGVRREGEALLLAVQTAEDALGAVVRAHRDQWLKASQRDEQRARDRGRQALDALTQALEDRARARAVGHWLTELLPREGRCRVGVLGRLPGSEVATANGDPLGTATALGWLSQMLADPERASAPVEPAPREPAVA